MIGEIWKPRLSESVMKGGSVEGGRTKVLGARDSWYAVRGSLQEIWFILSGLLQIQDKD